MKMAVKTMSPLAASVAKAQMTTPKNICCNTRTSSSVMSSKSPFSGPAEMQENNRHETFVAASVCSVTATNAYREECSRRKCCLFGWIPRHSRSGRSPPRWCTPRWVLGTLLHVRYIHLYLYQEAKSTTEMILWCIFNSIRLACVLTEAFCSF